MESSCLQTGLKRQTRFAQSYRISVLFDFQFIPQAKWDSYFHCLDAPVILAWIKKEVWKTVPLRPRSPNGNAQSMDATEAMMPASTLCMRRKSTRCPNCQAVSRRTNRFQAFKLVDVFDGDSVFSELSVLPAGCSQQDVLTLFWPCLGWNLRCSCLTPSDLKCVRLSRSKVPKRSCQSFQFQGGSLGFHQVARLFETEVYAALQLQVSVSVQKNKNKRKPWIHSKFWVIWIYYT